MLRVALTGHSNPLPQRGNVLRSQAACSRSWADSGEEAQLLCLRSLVHKNHAPDQFVITVVTATSGSAEVRIPRQFAGNTLALIILYWATAGILSDTV